MDVNQNLHFVSSFMDAQLVGGKFSGDASRPWFLSAIGSGITEASSGQQPNFTVDRNDYFSGGSGSDFGINETTNLGKGVNVKTTADFPSGSTNLTVQANANIAAGQAVYGACIPDGDAVATYLSGAMTLNAATACNLPSGSQLAFINAAGSTPNASPVGIQATVSSFTTGSPANSVSLGGYGFKFAPSGDIVFGANILCHSFTGRKSSVDGGGCLAAEVDTVVSGPDDNLNRLIIDAVFADSGPSADGPTTIGWGFRLRPSGANAQTTPNPAELLYGFSANTMATQPAGGAGQYGNFNHAHFCDGGDLTGCYDFVSGIITPSTVASGAAGQPNLDFPLGTNVNVGQAASATNIPAGTTVTATAQCWATQPLAACGGKTNEELVTLSANITGGGVANGATITFTGAAPDGSNFNGYFTDAFANWTNQNGTGYLKAGTTSNYGTVLDIRGQGEDSTSTLGIDYGDIVWAVDANTHGATLGHVAVTNAGFEVGAPTGGNEGVGSINAQAIYVNGVAVSGGGGGTVTTTGTPGSGNLSKFSGATSVTNGDLSGDCTTSGALAVTCTKTNGTPFGTAATANTGTSGGNLCLLNASCTYSGTTWTWQDGTTVTSSGFTMGAIIAMGNHGITGANGFVTNNANGGDVISSAASSTVPTLVPNRTSTTTGMGAQASGNLSLIAGGTEIERVSSSGIILESGAYFSGATSGVSCAANTVSLTTEVVTNGIVTHC
jgi:hypothetical protein